MELLNTLQRSGRTVAVLDLHTSIQELIDAASMSGYRVIYIDGVSLTTKDGFLEYLSGQLECPYFGGNWDALLDCLRDLGWNIPHPKGWVIVYDHPDILFQNDAKECATAIGILKDAADFWKSSETPMYLLLRADRPFSP